MRRDRLAVIHDILKIISENKNAIKPTPLLRKSNLSSQGFSEYYGELLSRGLIDEKEIKGRRTISLTDKGFHYIEKYRSILDFIDEFEL